MDQFILIVMIGSVCRASGQLIYRNNETFDLKPFDGEFDNVRYMLHGRTADEIIILQPHSVSVVNLATQPPMKTHLAGQYLRYGYQEGVGADALFHLPLGAILLNSTHLLVMDGGNSCIRLVSLSNRQTSRYAGLCGSEGDKDGTLLESRFSQPTGVIKYNDRYLINDVYFLRSMNDQYVSTFLAIGKYHLSTYLTAIDDMVYCVTTGSITRIDMKTLNVTKLLDTPGIIKSDPRDGSFRIAKVGLLHGIIPLGKELLLVADAETNTVRLINLKMGRVESLCIGSNHEPIPGQTNCTVDRPWSLLQMGSEVLISFAAERMSKIDISSIVGNTNSLITTTERQRKVKAGVIAGITIGLLLAIIMVVVIVVWVIRERRKMEAALSNNNEPPPKPMRLFLYKKGRTSHKALPYAVTDVSSKENGTKQEAAVMMDHEYEYIGEELNGGKYPNDSAGISEDDGLYYLEPNPPQAQRSATTSGKTSTDDSETYYIEPSPRPATTGTVSTSRYITMK